MPNQSANVEQIGLDDLARAVEAVKQNASFLVGPQENGWYVNPDEVVRHRRVDDQTVEFELSNGITITHKATHKGSIGHLLHAGIKRVRGKPNAREVRLPAFNRVMVGDPTDALLDDGLNNIINFDPVPSQLSDIDLSAEIAVGKNSFTEVWVSDFDKNVTVFDVGIGGDTGDNMVVKTNPETQKIIVKYRDTNGNVSLARFNYDGSGGEFIKQDFSNKGFNAGGSLSVFPKHDSAFVVNDGNLLEIPLDGSAVQTITTVADTDIAIDKDNELIYNYDQNTNVTVYDLEGNQKDSFTLNSFTPPGAINVHEEKLYVGDEAASELLRFNLDGSGREKIGNITIEGFLVVDTDLQAL